MMSDVSDDPTDEPSDELFGRAGGGAGAFKPGLELEPEYEELSAYFSVLGAGTPIGGGGRTEGGRIAGGLGRLEASPGLNGVGAAGGLPIGWLIISELDDDVESLRFAGEGGAGCGCGLSELEPELDVETARGGAQRVGSDVDGALAKGPTRGGGGRFARGIGIRRPDGRAKEPGAAVAMELEPEIDASF
jgi:hypothetical protein